MANTTAPTGKILDTEHANRLFLGEEVARKRSGQQCPFGVVVSVEAIDGRPAVIRVKHDNGTVSTGPRSDYRRVV